MKVLAFTLSVASVIANGNSQTNLLVMFSDAQENIDADLKFSIPGKERQDSVYNGFQVCAL